MATRRPVGGLDHLTTVPENFDPDDTDAAGDRDGGTRTDESPNDRLRDADGPGSDAGVGSDDGQRRTGSRDRRRDW